MAMELKKNDPGKAKQYFSDKLSFTTGPMELSINIKQGIPLTIVDVREPEDFQKGHIPGAINLPRTRWNNLEGLRKDTPNVVYCYSQECHLAATAAVEFSSKGYPVMEMEGGFDAWKEYGLEIETGVFQKTGKGEPVSV